MSYCENKSWPNWPMAPWPYTFEYRKNMSAEAEKYFCTCNRFQLEARLSKHSKLPVFHSESLFFEGKLRCAGCNGITKDRMIRCRECDALFETWGHPNLCPRYQLCKVCFSAVPVEDRCVCYGQELWMDDVEVPVGYLRVMPPKPLSMAEIDSFLEGF